MGEKYSDDVIAAKRHILNNCILKIKFDVKKTPSNPEHSQKITFLSFKAFDFDGKRLPYV